MYILREILRERKIYIERDIESEIDREKDREGERTSKIVWIKIIYCIVSVNVG